MIGVVIKLTYTSDEMFKLGILNDLINGNEPDVNEYETVDGLEKGGFSKIVKEMQEDGLIDGLVFRDHNVFFDQAQLTERGTSYYFMLLEKL